ncbi:hypothetical protein [Neptunicella sp.]|uniref:hypothetical protein n=1 Tax=Neptunicella sp. TaxID=2125986 RepID=UPI003F691477
MSAIQLLEMLGADSQFNKAQLSPEQLNDLIHLSDNDDEFEPPLTQVCPDDEDEDEDPNN